MGRPRDVSGRYLPAIETLQNRSTEALLRTLERFGVPMTRERLSKLADRALERVTLAPNPSKKLTEAETEKIARAMQRELAAVAKDFVRAEHRRANGLSGRGTGDRKAMWIAIMDNGTCEDCLDRHGNVKTMDEWEDIGIPGSPNLICNGSCRCDFGPLEMFDGEVEVEEIPDGEYVNVTVTVTNERD